ncbi:MAG: hypothetical protein AVDCRST_MAG93-2933 [uncultured Chloroflexia bacterium]|uniref:HTTM domain-containing protein n=1 Tax=uncultured Chloroflexia bacterium TaxID=1672391 RepID=A0A6J4JFG8_9CHLR|nr:MAG: hypothetical protein AVDCRST_MAG93-2933 [uncultured Chloroflexia bacterium]
MPLRITANTALRLREPPIAVVVALVVALSLVYDLVGRGAARVARLDGYLGVLVAGWVALVLFATWQRNYTYGEIWKPLRILIRGAAIVLFVQILFDALYPGSIVSNVFIGVYGDARLLIGLALLSGLVAVFKPSFVPPTLLAYTWFRHHAPLAFDLPVTRLDFTTLADVGLFSVLALLGLRILTTTPALARHQRLHEILTHTAFPMRFQKAVWGLCVGIHLGNYFHSALAKMRLGAGDLSFWILENPTAQGIAIGLHRLNNPIGGWPWLTDLYHDFLTGFSIPMNAAVLALQLLAPLSVVHRRAIIAFTIAFDLMHLGIYASLGAFFFLWIALNIIILVSLGAMRDSEFTAPVKLTALVASLFGFMSFSTAELGWLDGNKVVRELFVAHRTDGSTVLIPPAMFGLYAYQIGHGDLYVPAGHFKVRLGGNVTKLTEWEDAVTCGPAVVGEQPFVSSPERIGDMIRAMDGFYRRHEWVKDWNLPYFYPHHEPSNPAFFSKLSDLKMEEVVSYSYVVESACVGVADGRLRNHVRVRSVFPVSM